MKPISFRTQIAFLSALISGLVLVGFGTASWYLIHAQKIEGLDTEIRALSSRHPGWMVNPENCDHFNGSLEYVFGGENNGQVLLLVKNSDGKPLYKCSEWPEILDPNSIDCTLAEDPKATNSHSGGLGIGMGRGGMGRGPGFGRGGSPVVFTKTPRFSTVTVGDSEWRIGVMGNADLRLIIGLSYEPVKAELNRIRNIFLLVLPLALLLVGGGGWYVAGRALRPLNKISEMAENMTASALDQRIPGFHEAPEIARLISVLNQMMDRLQISFQQAIRFSADASHELKTPLAIMQGELENALQGSAPGSSEQQVFSNLMEETQRLKTITRGLLLLSQADSGRLKLVREEFDLSKELECSIEDAKIISVDQELRFDISIPQGTKVFADRGLLQIAIQNLISNAIRYNQKNGLLKITLSEDEKAIELLVVNSGSGIPSEEQDKIFNRFYRINPSHSRNTDGLGLGLSLAREIVHAHSGSLVLKESRTGWTCFCLTLNKR